jgi:plastocyanin
VTAYYVLGITFVLFAFGLFAIGVTREDFPPTLRGGRVVMAIAGLIALVTFAVLVSTTEPEHPREEAAEKAAEKKAEEAGGAKPGEAAGGAVQVAEKEYSITLPGGDKLKSGKLTLAVANQGKIPHDVEIENAPKKPKTPLIDPGKNVSLEADLKPGKYTLICTVPGHEQLGMKTDIQVGG